MHHRVGVCGQVPPPLTKQLENIIRDYSGKQLINELLQNADDAEATLFCVCLDKRQHPTKSLLCEQLQEFQGPAILQFDNKNFKESDYESIQRLGDGLKKGDPTKTGQFGLGFNSCYHVTDLPSFVSGKHLVILDPHSRYLPTPGVTGLYYQLIPTSSTDGSSERTLVDEYPDQLSPYLDAFGCNGLGQWRNGQSISNEGTLFRFPLRTLKIARSSNIKKSSSAPTLESVYSEIFDPFLEDLSSRLLFLKHVQTIKVYVWEHGDPAMKLIACSEIANRTPSLMHDRSIQLRVMKDHISRLSAANSSKKKDDTVAVSEGSDMVPVDIEQRLRVHMNVQECMGQANPSIRPCYSLWLSTSFVTELSPGQQQRLSEHKSPMMPSRQFASKGCNILVHQTFEHYIVSLGYGDADDIAFVCSDQVREARMFLVPYAGVAALVCRNVRCCSLLGSELRTMSGSHEIWPSNLIESMITEDVSNVHLRQQLQELKIKLAGQPVTTNLTNLTGKLFCCLPTSINTGLPVHVDARWELTRDRNHLAGHTNESRPARLIDADSLRGEWNNRLGCRIAAAAYTRLLCLLSTREFRCNVPWSIFVTSSTHPADEHTDLSLMNYYSLFPSCREYQIGWVSLLVASLYSMLGSKFHPLWSSYFSDTSKTPDIKVIHGLTALGSSWAPQCLQKAFLDDVEFAHFNDVMFLPEPESARIDILIEPLLTKGCRLTNANSAICDSLSLYTEWELQLSPARLRDWIRSIFRHDSSSTIWCSNWTDQQAMALAKYLTIDFDSNTPSDNNVNEQWKRAFHGVAFLPVESGNLTLTAGAPNGDFDSVHLMSPAYDNSAVCITFHEDYGNKSEQSPMRMLFRILAGLQKSQRHESFEGISLSECVIYLLIESATQYIRPFSGYLAVSRLDILVVSDVINMAANDLLRSQRKPELLKLIEVIWQCVQIEALQACLAQHRPENLLTALTKMKFTPLLPCNSGEILMLNMLDSVLYVPTYLSAAPSQISYSEEQENSVLLLLEHLQLPTLQSSLAQMMQVAFSTIDSPSWKLSTLNPPDVIRVLCTVPCERWSIHMVHAELRYDLLRYISSWLSGTTSIVSEGYLAAIRQLKTLPLFLTENNSWVSLQESVANDEDVSFQKHWFMLPDFDGGFTANQLQGVLHTRPDMAPAPAKHSLNFLRRPPTDLMKLYANLGIQAQPREQFYASFILTKQVWRSMDEDLRLEYLSEIKSHYGEMCDKPVVIAQKQEDSHAQKLDISAYLRENYGINIAPPTNSGTVSFHFLISNSPIFPRVNSTLSMLENDANWLAAVQLVDNSVPFLNYFYSQRIPPKALTGTAVSRRTWCRFLEQLGMSTSVTTSFLRQCAIGIAQAYSTMEGEIRSSTYLESSSQDENLSRLVTSATILCNHIVRNWLEIAFEIVGGAASGGLADIRENIGESTYSPQSVVAHSSVREWFAEIGCLPIVPVMMQPPSYFQYLTAIDISKRLVPFSGSVLCKGPSSPMTLFKSCWSVNYVCMEFDHAIHEEFRRLVGSLAVPTVQNLVNHLHCLCRFQNECIEFAGLFEAAYGMKSGTPVAELLSHVDATLDCLDYHAHRRSEESNAAEDIFVGLHGRDCIPVKPTKDAIVLHFVQPSQVFVELQDSIPPYAYDIFSVPILLGKRGLFAALQLNSLPGLDDVLLWFQMMAATHGDVPLGRNEISEVNNLAELAAALLLPERQHFDMHRKPIGTGDIVPAIYDSSVVYLPDKSGVLRCIESNIFFDDAPYLNQCIDKSKIRFLHPNISSSAASILGLRSLSTAVTEVVQHEDIAIIPQSTLNTSVPKILLDELVKWQANLVSTVYQGALRQIMLYNQFGKLRKLDGNASKTLRPEQPGVGIGFQRLWLLNKCSIQLASSIKTKFILTTGSQLSSNQKGTDITRESQQVQSPAVLTYNRSSSSGLSNELEIPYIYLLWESTTTSSVRAWTKRCLASMAVAINNFLDNTISDSTLITALLDCDSEEEIIEQLNYYRIPLPPQDLTLGSTVILSDTSWNQFEPLTTSIESSDVDVKIGDSVYWCDEDGLKMYKGKILSIARQAEKTETKFTVIVSPDGFARDFSATELYSQSSRSVQTMPALRMGNNAYDEDNQGDGIWLSEKAKDDSDYADSNGATGPPVERVLYQPANSKWADDEMQLLLELQQRQARVDRQPLENEPQGVDAFLLTPPSVHLPIGTAKENDQFQQPAPNPDLKEVQVGIQTRKGFNLVRVGNYHEDANASVQDIAFFHHLPTLKTEFTMERELFVRLCCGILREVSSVFKFEAAMVTLFYEVGATSRFIRQKLMFNLAPIDIFCRSRGISDPRQHPFAYTYFFGLFVHKLAHFFDVVHGTRHDFFCTEYRSLFMLDWIELLERKGFDVDSIHQADFAQEHLWEIVF